MIKRKANPSNSAPVKVEPPELLSEESRDAMPVTVRVFAVAFGAFLGLSLVKFGNPPIFEKWVTAPGNVMEFFLICPWPITWAYVLVAMLAILALGLKGFRPAAIPPWLAALPLVWLGWQIASASQSVAPGLSWPTVFHFGACVLCFYLGLFGLARSPNPSLFLAGLIGGFVLVLASGFTQHFGGLEESRRYFYLYIYPQLKEIPPDYVKKLSSNRIFATLFYPNALAGVILLILPPVLCRIALARFRFTAGARMFLCLVVGSAALACLVWSGSKGGWLLILFLGFLALLRVPFSRRVKAGLIALILVAGLAGFGLRYAGFFRKGATSVVARFDYWRAALVTAAAHPFLGTGPGTFAKPYEAIKDPASEMSRLTHNDYLEQASDSGWPGLAFYTVLIAGGLWYSFPRPEPGQVDSSPAARQRHAPADLSGDWLVFALWLGVLGWALQSLFEFSLYIPALAWPAFSFLGWLVGRRGACAYAENPCKKPTAGTVAQ